jgi:arsenate reductase
MADRRAGRESTRVLFLCTHNSARSQMAEGLLRDMAGDRFEVFSAGTEATCVKPEAISVLAEIGVDISSQESETLDRYLGESLDLVIIICHDPNEACPVFPGESACGRFETCGMDPSLYRRRTGETRGVRATSAKDRLLSSAS